MDLRLLCLFLVCLSLSGLVNADEIGNEAYRGRWKKIFEDVNSAAVPKEYDNTEQDSQGVKPIRYGTTRIRIKHSATNRYLKVVDREDWPAATTGLSRSYYFMLYNYGSDGMVIKTLNSMHPRYEYLSVWNQVVNGGWIYGNPFDHFNVNKKIYWSVSKTLPLYDGDVVTFKSQHHLNAYLCVSDQVGHDAKDNVVTDVFACPNQADEWVLEVVD